MCCLAIALLASGLLRLTVETDPQQLWAASSSAAAQEKRAFDVRSHPKELYLLRTPHLVATPSLVSVESGDFGQLMCKLP